MRPTKRDELVQKALSVFYSHGFHATGMDRLVAETGISKTSMYKHFRTKEDLILAALRLRDEQFRNWLYRRMEEEASTSGGQLLAMFEVLREWFTHKDFAGCMFIKASAEFAKADHPIHVQSAEHKRMICTHLCALAKEAGARDPDALARQLLLLKEGATVAAHLRYTEDPAGDAVRAAQVLLDAELGNGFVDAVKTG
ncbi:TetR/AcrR family transcriptional regulator [Roseovarius tibetensis]|uniref:TetR/AcrR family transcriptional regulator n=1 Tax=Roseovarius tibetensis TaxID=2685897 RepID=UPI003D7F7FDE